MRVNITARHFKAPNNLKEFAEKKVQKLKRYYDGIIVCDILLDHEKLTQIADISIKVYGQNLKAVEKTEDIFKSIELSVDKLERQLKKYKEKLRHHKHDKGEMTETEPPVEQE
ncbi:MAG: ribosome-associated translation inhibitor RaiA [Caldithrix sp.]|nr:MAG: ribosome-associated translation inhibitor RaiA [Caldithrix sp.]